jgi:hypothetical protein
MRTRTRTSSVITNNNNCYSVWLLLILNIIISTSTLSTTTKSTSTSSFFIVVPFAESFYNSPSQLLPTRRRRHTSSLSSSSSLSKIRTNINGTATNNKSAVYVVVGGRNNNAHISSQDYFNNNVPSNNHAAVINRRDLFGHISSSMFLAVASTMAMAPIQQVYAYTPDPDKLQESLYFISRVQEATVQQERFITNAYRNTNQGGGDQKSGKELQSKLKLTLLLVEKNYKLLDQINYCSQFIQPEAKLIDSSEAGYQAVDELQNAIDYVRNDNNWNTNDNNSSNSGGGTVTEQQYTYLISSLKECREQLFIFLKYMEPKEKLLNARLRVENENIQNRIEFGDANDIDDNKNKNAGVYNPVILPWK